MGHRLLCAVAAALVVAAGAGCRATPAAAPTRAPAVSPSGVSPSSVSPSDLVPSGVSPSGVNPSGAGTATPAPPSPPSTTPGPSGATLRSGDRGPQVVSLQRDLLALGYWLPAADGVYGASTVHAVTALQKVAGLQRDGVAGPRTRAALRAGVRPAARSRTGRVIEVDLARQVLLVAVDGRVAWVLDTSTGVRAGTTPTGRFSVYRQVDGYDHGPLGTLYRPKYFWRGVAVHGFTSVPAYPASHGCVRVTNTAMDWLWASATLPIGRPVWVY